MRQKIKNEMKRNELTAKCRRSILYGIACAELYREKAKRKSQHNNRFELTTERRCLDVLFEKKKEKKNGRSKYNVYSENINIIVIIIMIPEKR